MGTQTKLSSPRGANRGQDRVEITEKVQLRSPRTTGRPLKFVTSIGTPNSNHDPQSRKLVRVQAMRSFLWQKGAAIPDPAADSHKHVTPVASLKENTGRFKLASWSRKSRKRKIASPRIRADERGVHNVKSIKELGVINVLPIPLSSKTQELLYHYHNNFTQNSFAVNPEGSFFAFAISDATILNAILTMVAQHFHLSHGMDETAEVSYYRNEAIRMINQRLVAGDAPPDDALIGAVALLANCETSNGSAEGSSIHINGLNQMVQLRGGILAFEENAVLQRVLTWTDFSFAATYNHSPRFGILPKLSSNLEPSTHFISASIADLASPELSTIAVTSWEVLEIMDSLDRISAAITSFQGTLPERISISNAIYLVERRLISVKSEAWSTFFEPSAEFDLSEPLRYAAHLFLHMAVRELPGKAKMHDGLLRRLRNALPEYLNVAEMVASEFSLGLLLWIYFMGAAASRKRADRAYFVAGLIQVSEAVAVESAGAFEGALKSVLWLDGFCKSRSSALWEEMTEIQDSWG
ncbi:uncharacterized protein BDZ99DRAFT_463264 [Mytilinidion resinicola]|uniref:Uncharacterized protein n=1 Tax=Mytilinidion resinicola TaxID=574789 RepID=A0A6A6YKZ4_9PEZI|nr:uncharacterized protein BDZ99DRAFT_463264 [Mytilinidion resinicola]KAF2809470.1 hypothetical protein BDZ99DRAFT_463264 [Mytilinidion resinicola]